MTPQDPDEKLWVDWKQLLRNLHQATGLAPEKLVEMARDVFARYMQTSTDKGKVVSITTKLGEIELKEWPMPKGHMKPFP